MNIFHMMSKGTKLLAILIALSFVFNTQLKAQYYESDYGGMVGGIYAGMNVAQIDGDGYSGYSHWGYTGGGFLLMPINNAGLPFKGTIAYSVGVQFTQKGAKGSDPRNGILNQTIDLNYGEVPVLIHYYRGPRDFNIGMGFSFGYLAWEETAIDFGSGLQQVENHYRKFDLNFVFAPQIHIWKGFYISPKFQYSFVNIKNKNVPTVGRTEQYNDVLSLNISYIFGGNPYRY